MDFHFFSHFILILALSIACISLLKRFNLPESLAYLFVGVLISPNTFGLMKESVDLELLAEIGVVFLLFTIGLEFSLKKIKTLKKEVFVLGGLQVFITTVVVFGLLYFLNYSIFESFLVSSALSLSSTAVVSKELTQQNLINSASGKLAIGVLLFQDIAAILFLILIPNLAKSGGGQDLWYNLILMLLKGGFFVVLLLSIGRWILPRIFHEIAKSHSEELFVLTALFLALMAAWFAHFLGLSMALGGFVAGMMLGESLYKHQVKADIKPFRDLLLGLFFVSIGLMLNFSVLKSNWVYILIITLGLILFKFLLVFFIARLFGSELNASSKSALFLAQGGEFCFALIALGTQYQVMNANLIGIVLASTILSMMLAPILMRNAHKITLLLFSKYSKMKKIANVKHDNLDEESVLKNNVSKLQQHTLICGYGRVGQTVSRLLAQENKPYVVIDGDPMHVQEASRAGEPVFFGDCLRIEMLESMGLSKARQVVLCIDNVQSALQIVKNIRLKVLSLPIVVRTKHYEDAELLKYAGATVVVPEMLECSLTVAKHVLFMLGLSAETVKNRIQNARKQRYEILNSYYPGINDFLSDSENKEHRYAVEINEHSSLLGKRIDHFEAEDAGKITVVELVRDGVRSYPDKSTVLQLNDKIIISGSGSYIAKIEREL